MSQPKVINEVPVSMSFVKSELARIKKKDEQLNFRASKCDEYLSQFAPLSLQKADELKESLQKMDIPRLKDEHIVKIVDLLPSNVEDVKLVLSGYTINVSQDNMKKIAETVSKFASK
jgi:DNA-directed RNA polymerase subunit F